VVAFSPAAVLKVLPAFDPCQNFSESETKKWVVEQKKRFTQDDSMPTRDRQVDRIITTVRTLDLTQVAPSPSQRQELEQLLEAILQGLRNYN